MITNPDNHFRLMIKVWAGNYRGEQPFYSAPQKNLLEVLQLVKGIEGTPLHTLVRSYVIHEDLATGTGSQAWQTLDHSDWKDL